MAMTKIELEQGTDNWLQWRNAGIGASEAASVLDKNPWCSSTMLLNKKLGTKAEKFSKLSQSRMQRGKDLEPRIREIYTAFTGIKCEPVCCASTKYPWMLASLDGLSECGEIVVEIKAPNSESHIKALNENVPEHYYWQVLHQLVVTDARIGHYVSWCDARQFLPEDQLAIVKVERDPEKEQYLIDREREWWEWYSNQKAILQGLRDPEE